MGMTAYFKILNPSEFKKLCTKPDEFEDILFPDDCDDPFEGQLCLEKEWHGLHYVLCKSPEPDGSALGDAILGGNEIGPDLGYGHGRLINSGRVKEISEALNGVNFRELYDQLDRNNKEIEKLYSSFEFDEIEREYHLELLNRLKDVYSQASENGQEIFTYFA